MVVSKSSADECDELYDWLNSIQFSRQKRNLARDFSDGGWHLLNCNGLLLKLRELVNEIPSNRENLTESTPTVLVAEILKRFYPRYVELHNYNSANSHAAKMQNWLTLDRKVLSHLGLREPHTVYSELATCSRGKIEEFLLKIKRKLDDEEDERERLYAEQHCRCDQDMPSYDEYTNLLENLNLKENEIQSLNNRISHLESLVSYKDQRIQDLNYQISNCKCNQF